MMRDRRTDRRLAYLEEAVYHGIGGRDGTNPAVRVPMRPELGYQALPDSQDVREVAQFIICGLGLWQTLVDEV